jgi:hypothetical protein
MITKENFTNFKIGLNQFRGYLEKVSNKTEKGKKVLTKKTWKGPGAEFSPQPKPAHGPASFSPKLVCSSSSFPR